jgi:predicted glycosyltransferase
MRSWRTVSQHRSDYRGLRGYRISVAERYYVGYVTGATPDPGPLSDPPLGGGLSGSGNSGAPLYDRLLDVVQLRVEAGALRLRLVIGQLAKPGPRVVEADRLGWIEVWRTGSVTEAVRGASAVVSSVGYNTTFAFLQTQLPIAFCPWERPDGSSASATVLKASPVYSTLRWRRSTVRDS